ncbi:MAG TPA: sigma-70 family RNA polymerase sigma factor [Pyrinomonadaceae bacterium]
MSSRVTATEHATALDEGAQSLGDDLVVLVYQELRRLANNYLQRERPNHTLQPTALVHEAYLRLIGQSRVRWRNRDHFIAVAAEMMRRVLVDYARTHNRDKRGGGDYKVPLAEVDHFTIDRDVDLLALDEALQRFAEDYPRESRIVELRFFGGLSIADTARVLKLSDSTVERDWKFARAWLLRDLRSR